MTVSKDVVRVGLPEIDEPCVEEDELVCSADAVLLVCGADELVCVADAVLLVCGADGLVCGADAVLLVCIGMGGSAPMIPLASDPVPPADGVGISNRVATASNEMGVPNSPHDC